VKRVLSFLGIDGEADEGERVGLSCALFFFVFAGWYVIRPVRDAMGIVGSVSALPRLVLVTLAVTLAAAPALSAIVSRFSTRRFLTIAYRFILLTLVVFYALVRDGAPHAYVAQGFFVWSSVINLFAITLAWGFMAELFTHAQGLRLFALVGAGGTLGAIVGSVVTVVLVPRTGAPLTLLVSAALLEAAVQCVRRLARRFHAPSDPSYGHTSPRRDESFAWLRRVVSQPYFLAICGYMTLFTFTSTVFYLDQAKIVKASLASTSARTTLFAQMDLAVNGVALLLQVFVAARVIRAVGVGASLAVLPIVTLLGFAWVRYLPTLAVLVICQVARRTVDFALAKPTREVLFTVVDREDKYKAKSFIDTFVYRSGDAMGAWGFAGLAGGALASLMVAMCVAWAAVGILLARPARRTRA
jgi:AAA family ATP:ADP antiporter